MKFSLPTVLLTLFATFIGSAQSDTSRLFQINKIQDFKIEFEEENWPYLLDSLRYNGDELLTGDLLIQGKRLEGVGVRIRDAHSFDPGSERNSLFIKLDHSDPDQHFEGYKSLNLSAGLRDPSMVREVLGYEIARQFMPTPFANYARVSINNRLYGLMVNIEPVGDVYLQRYFNDQTGSLYQSRSDRDRDTPEGCSQSGFASLVRETRQTCLSDDFLLIRGDSYDPLVELTRILNASQSEIENILHVDNVLWYLAFNNITANLSSYLGMQSANYYLYQDAEGRFVPMVADLNLIFGTFKNLGSGSDLSIGQLETLDPMLYASDSGRPLVSSLLSNTFYVKVYRAHCRQILDEIFKSGYYEQRARQLQELIREDFQQDDRSYYSINDFDRSLVATIGSVIKVPGIVDFMEARTDFLKKHEELIYLPPRIDNVVEKRRERFSSEQIQDFQIQATTDEFAQRLVLYYRFDPKAEFSVRPMFDDGEHFDEKANDNIFGVKMEPGKGQDTIEYYIQAENVKMTGYYPDRYMQKRRIVSLTELN